MPVLKVCLRATRHGGGTKETNVLCALFADEKKNGVSSPAASVASPGPVVNQLDDTARETFATGRPLEDSPDLQQCKHCKKSVIKTAAKAHIAACLKVKKEKAQRKKEAREARERAKEAAQKETEKKAEEKDEDSDDDKEAPPTKKGAGKKPEESAATNKGGKKRKADGEAGGPKKKKKDEVKKVPKPKGKLIGCIILGYMLTVIRTCGCGETVWCPPTKWFTLCALIDM